MNLWIDLLKRSTAIDLLIETNPEIYNFAFAIKVIGQPTFSTFSFWIKLLSIIMKPKTDALLLHQIWFLDKVFHPLQVDLTAPRKVMGILCSFSFTKSSERSASSSLDSNKKIRVNLYACLSLLRLYKKHVFPVNVLFLNNFHKDKYVSYTKLKSEKNSLLYILVKWKLRFLKALLLCFYSL